MNQELCKQAKSLAVRINDLNQNIYYCTKAMENIKSGRDIRLLGSSYNIDISGCGLDDAQRQLLEQLFTGILKNRIEEAERELRSLLPAGVEETAPEMGEEVLSCADRAPRRRRI